MKKNFVFVLVMVALFAALLSACSPADLIAAASSNVGGAPSHGMNVNLSPRISTCSVSTTQLLLNDANGQTDEQAQKITVDQFLDARMPNDACITPRPADQ